jgi:effector-binding domain-containing protein
MKALKIIGIILLLVIIAFLIGAALIPKEFKVEATTTIDKPPALVFKQVNNFENWSAWSPWEKADPKMKSEYGGPTLGVGAYHSWISETQGNGKQTITESIPYELIRTELDFYQQGKGTSYFTFSEVNGGTNVTWGMRKETAYPVERVVFFFLKGMMQNMFDEGLEKLKEVCENKADPPVIEETKTPEMIALAIIDSCSWNEVGPKMEEMFEKLFNTIRIRGLAMTGMPYTKYLVWDEERQFTVFEAGIPINEKTKSKGNIEVKMYPEQKAIKGTHFGAYDKTIYLYLALDEYLLEHGLEMAGGPMEVYVTGPQNEADTSKWQTDIYFPYQ